MNSKAEIFRKCFNGKMRSIPKLHEFNKISNLFLYSYMQNMLSTSSIKNKRYLISADNTIIKKNFNQEFITCYFSQPHPSKIQKGGDDCFLICKELLAVADGVGGWKALGIDPSDYSKFLCDNLKNVYLVNTNEDEKESDSNIDELRLKKFIIEATKKTNLMGSSTLCAVLIDNKRNCFYSAYIGDSVYMVLRYKEGKYSKLFKSQDLTHKFNHPFQLGIKGDDPEKSVVAKHDLDINDIIILGTDGLWDNVHDNEIESILNENLGYYREVEEDCKNQKFLNDFTEKLSSRAVKNSMNKKFISPFSLKARAFNQFKMGGKKDDITIIVAFIQEKIYRNNLLKNNIIKNRSFYDISKKIKQIRKKAINPTEDFIKNFETINLNSAESIQKEELYNSNKSEYLMSIDNSNNNLNESFH